MMSTVDEIEDAIHKLPDEDLAALRAWLAESDAAEWDRQFESDVAYGRLDSLADEVLRNRHEGRCIRPLARDSGSCRERSWS